MIAITRIGGFHRVAAGIFRGGFCISGILCILRFIGKLGLYIRQAYTCHRRGSNVDCYPIVYLIIYFSKCINRSGSLSDGELRVIIRFINGVIGIVNRFHNHFISACVRGQTFYVSKNLVFSFLLINERRLNVIPCNKIGSGDCCLMPCPVIREIVQTSECK